MTDRAEIERLLNATGRTLEELPTEDQMFNDPKYPEKIDEYFKARNVVSYDWPHTFGLYQSQMIELLVGALRDALEKPMQRPLALEELKEAEIVWVEIDDESETIPALNDGISDKCVYFIMGHGRHTHSYIEQYGKYWRAWESRPTDKEREAAAWEI